MSFLLPLLLQSSSAQEPKFDASASVDIVSVPVTVTTGAGRFIFGLTRDDFEVRDDGDRRPLTQFSAERVPVSLGILLDISASMASDPKSRALDDARWADTRRALELLATRLHASDEVFLAAFNERVGLAFPWTLEHRRLVRALDGIRPGGTTAMFNAVKLIAPAFQLAQHSRKVLLLITDGQDSQVPTLKTGPTVVPFNRRPDAQVELERSIYEKQLSVRNAAVADVQRVVATSGATVYAIGIGTRNGGTVNVENLESLTIPSGGYVEPVTDPAGLADAMARICDELQAQYFLAFSSPRVDGKTHAIAVTTRNRNLRVRARSQYVAAPPKH